MVIWSLAVFLYHKKYVKILGKIFMISFFGIIGIIFGCTSPSYGADKHNSGFVEMDSVYVNKIMSNQEIFRRFHAPVYEPRISENNSGRTEMNYDSPYPHKTPEIQQEQHIESVPSVFPLKLNIPQVTAEINQCIKTMLEFGSSNSIQSVSEEMASNTQPVNNKAKRKLEKTDSHQPRKKPHFTLDQNHKQYSFVSVENIDGKYREVKPYTPKKKNKYSSVNNGDGYPRMDQWKYK